MQSYCGLVWNACKVYIPSHQTTLWTEVCEPMLLYLALLPGHTQPFSTCAQEKRKSHDLCNAM